MSIMIAPVTAITKTNAHSPAPKGRQPSTRPAGTGIEVTSDRIRARAYEIYQARNGNGGTGDALSDWAQAERELNGSATGPSGVSDVEIKAQARGERLLASGE